MIIGGLQAATLDGKEELEGWLQSLTLDLRYRLKLVHDRRGENSPNYQIFARNKQSGKEVCIGGAWTKTAVRGPHAGENFS